MGVAEGLAEVGDLLEALVEVFVLGLEVVGVEFGEGVLGGVFVVGSSAMRAVTISGSMPSSSAWTWILILRSASAICCVGVNGPFRGTHVPFCHYKRDRRVTSLMLEIRRDIYLRADGGPDQDAISRLASAIAALIAAVTRTRA